MAAYFLPSYFQKRLLRYALSRLDFIDSDALDLDNLGVTIGQRSVIELKNVGVKVSKLVERIDLPNTIRLQHASIRVLRVTVPADLHVSGIEVEIDGVNVEVEFDQNTQQDDSRGKNKRGGNAPSHRDIANRPRIGSTAVHDPGGLHADHRHTGMDASHILPAPEDLAASFLDAEPEREKQELQAAVESRSLYLQQSTSGLDGSISEDGIGAPDGFSLPGFVTNFFAGIADRLSVMVKNVALHWILVPETDSGRLEQLEFILKVDEIELSGLEKTPAESSLDKRRSVKVVGVELLVASEADSFHQKSSASSPRLSKSRYGLSASTRHATGPSHNFASNLHSSPSSSTNSFEQAQLGLGVHESMLESSQLFDPTLDPSDRASSSGSPEMNRLSPTLSRDSQPLSAKSSLGSQEDLSTGNDLAESKLFSHDEAESMFMSAMSNVRASSERMPGGFDESTGDGSPIEARPRASSSHTLRQEHDSNPRQEEPASVPDLAQDFGTGNADPPPLQEARENSQPSSTSPPIQKCSKRILRVNEVTLRMPRNRSRDANFDDPALSSSHVRPGSAGRERFRPSSSYISSASHARNVSDQSTYGISKQQAVDMDPSSSVEILIGDVEMSIDITLCHILLRTTTKLSSAKHSSTTTPEQTPQRPSDTQFRLSMQSVILNFMESVPEISALRSQRIPTESTFSVRGDDMPVLQLQILKVEARAAMRSGIVDQKLTIHRLGLYREDDKIISFFDPSALQESFVASSVMLEPDDVIVRRLDDRMEATIKPVHIMLDLLVIDDVLSRSGGLSTLLELSNSVASAGAMKEGRPQSSSGPTRRRSVHFDDSVAKPHRETQTALKLNLRVSGAVVDLVGSQSSIQIKSSAIKLVYRSALLRTNISSVSVRGPIVRSQPVNDLLTMRLGDIQVGYLETPTEEDLDRLLQLLVPSSDKYEQDDDIMVDTLLRQRRKGAVLRLTVQDVQLSASGLAWMYRMNKLGEEIAKLSSVTKYLPEDDRPGILIFALVNKFSAQIEIDKQFGPLILKSALFEGALISVPTLMAAQISSLSLSRAEKDELVRELIPNMQQSTALGPPMLMCRFIPDEMEPTVKLKLSSTCFEYSVPLLLAITQLAETVQRDLSQRTKMSSPRESEVSTASSETSDFARKAKLSLELRNSGISLRPLDSTACSLLLFNDALMEYSSKHAGTLIKVDIRKASIMLIDDVARVGNEDSGLDSRLFFDRSDQVQELIKSGFVPVGSISAASADVKISEDKLSKKQFIDVEFRNNLLFLETCADSTQTLIQVLSGLSPPTPPSKIDKYRTQVVPLQDMLASWTGNAFVAEQGPELGMRVDEGDTTPTPSTILAQGDENQTNRLASNDDDDDDETYMNDLYLSQADDDEGEEKMTESSILSRSTHSSGVGGASVHIAPVNITADNGPTMVDSVMMHSLIDFRDDHFTQRTSIGGTAHRWESAQNTYGMGNETTVQQSPLKVRVRDVHIIWNLYDGYDWQNTREVITQAVRDVEDKAIAKQRRRDSHRSPGADDDDESVVGDVLFNSIYISIPTNRDPRELTNAINAEIAPDAMSETGSYATSTTVTATTSKRQSGPRYKPKKLRLNRSKSHKLTFELEGLAVDFFTFPPDTGEVESSVDIRVKKLEIFDHVPTSTWRKFATYMHEAGEREVGTDMVHIELLNVKPVAELAASEIVLKATVLPLRLHVDQDALDFMTRFFEFKDDRASPSGAPSNPPFIQRAEVNPIKIRLDFKPKRVDYAGLKSGKLTEFMNFIILERSDMVLRRVILYGVSGFDRLGIMLNNIWTPDVRNNQLPGVLAGLAPVRSLVDVGSGVRDLIAVPIREYKKDGRIVRSIQKGALAFAKTTTTELVNLGAKLAIGTQTVLQNAEDVLAPQNRQSHRPQSGYASDSEDDDHPKVISHYADQPLGIIQGLRGAYASLERDLLLAKDAIVAVPGEIMAEGSAAGAAKVVLKSSPTIILRPAIGVSKAMGQAFLGAGNTLDKGNRKRIEDKYKRH